MDATPEKPESGGRQRAAAAGFLPDFREAIKAARGRHERDRVRAVNGQSLIRRNPPIRTAMDFAGRWLRTAVAVAALTKGRASIGARIAVPRQKMRP